MRAAFEVGWLIKFLLAMFLLITAIIVLIFLGGYGNQMLDTLAAFFSFRGVGQ